MDSPIHPPPTSSRHELYPSRIYSSNGSPWPYLNPISERLNHSIDTILPDLEAISQNLRSKLHAMGTGPNASLPSVEIHGWRHSFADVRSRVDQLNEEKNSHSWSSTITTPRCACIIMNTVLLDKIHKKYCRKLCFGWLVYQLYKSVVSPVVGVRDSIPPAPLSPLHFLRITMHSISLPDSLHSLLTLLLFLLLHTRFFARTAPKEAEVSVWATPRLFSKIPHPYFLVEIRALRAIMDSVSQLYTKLNHCSRYSTSLISTEFLTTSYFRQ